MRVRASVAGLLGGVLLLAGCSTSEPTPSPEPVPASPVATSTGIESPAPTPTETPGTLTYAFAHPEAGGIATFLRDNPRYLPATMVVGAEVASGSATGALDINLTAIPSGTSRLYLSIACTDQVPYRMEVRRDGAPLGAGWSDSCGYWGGLHGFQTPAFDPLAPPNQLHVEVSPGTRYSFVVFAVQA